MRGADKCHCEERKILSNSVAKGHLDTRIVDLVIDNYEQVKSHVMEKQRKGREFYERFSSVPQQKAEEHGEEQAFGKIERTDPAEIFAVADTIEAMSSHRPYRPALGIEKALAEIERGRGTVYDATVADACLRLFREKGYAIPA